MLETNIYSRSTAHTPSHKTTHRIFFLLLYLSRTIVFTDAIAILGGIQWFSNSNKAFIRKQNTDTESAQKTESNELSCKLI